MKRILQIFSYLGNGGAENRMMDVYRCINTDIIQFDFAVVQDTPGTFDQEVRNRGGLIHILPDPRKGLLKNYIAFYKFFKEHKEYQIIHAHVAWYAGIVLMAAWQAGVKIRIAHARDSKNPNQTIKDKCFNNIGKLLIGLFATQKIAISPEAAENIFGSRARRKNKYLFVPNSIDQTKYMIQDQDSYQKIRHLLKIPVDKKAYVCVGNLRPQKNHMFLLEIAKSLKDKNENFILYLIGEGKLRNHIERRISELGLDNNVKMFGRRDDVPQILAAFDTMIFPSYFEGLGGVVLEAQLVGIPVVASDAIPEVADVNVGLLKRLSLKLDADFWAQTVIAMSQIHRPDRIVIQDAFKNKGYCIQDTAKRYLLEYGIQKNDIDKALQNIK